MFVVLIVIELYCFYNLFCGHSWVNMAFWFLIKSIMNSNFQFKFRNSRFYLTSLIVQLPSFLHTEKSLFSPVLPSCPVGNDLNIF